MVLKGFSNGDSKKLFEQSSPVPNGILKVFKQLYQCDALLVKLFRTIRNSSWFYELIQSSFLVVTRQGFNNERVLYYGGKDR